MTHSYFLSDGMIRALLKVSLIIAAISFAAAAIQADEPPSAPGENKPNGVTPDLVYGHKDGMALTMDLYEPTAKANGAAVLFMVSGGWYSAWAPPEATRHWVEPYLNHGYKAFAVRHGSSPRYSIPEAVEDVRAAVRFVRRHADEFSVDADRLGVFGMSAGGHLALMLGTTGEDGQTAAFPTSSASDAAISSKVAAVVALVPPTDLRVAVWTSPESLPAYRNFPALNLPMEQAGTNSPLVQVTSDDAPSLVIMGGDDALVPPRHGTWIEEAFQAQHVPSKLLILEGVGHDLGGGIHREKIYSEALEWFGRHMPAKDDAKVPSP